MDWGTAPAWVAIAVSVGAAYIAYMAQRNSRRSADTAAKALQLQEEAAEERRKAAQPRADLHVRYYNGDTWMIANEGTADAVGLRVIKGAERGLLEPYPKGAETLMAGDQTPVIMTSAMGSGLPKSLRVTWDGLAEPVVLKVPPKA